MMVYKLCPSAVQTDNAPKIRFSAALGEQQEVKVAIV